MKRPETAMYPEVLEHLYSCYVKVQFFKPDREKEKDGKKRRRRMVSTRPGADNVAHGKNKN
jgi:hypothetical protein